MLTLKIDFKCPLCGQSKNFYIMPEEKKVGNGNDTITSLTEFVLRCKHCQKKFILSYNIEIV